ncbi:hypothetical protein A3Q32_09030 [Alcanivorax sp. KX64203]|nr:hypothetical protein A3Q32_09030 [Alcanivorax sp. KX64203]
MKRLMLGALVLGATPLVQAAPLVDAYFGAYTWDAEISGDIASGGGDIDVEHDLGLDESRENVLFVGVEHAIPLIPNARIRHMEFSEGGSHTLGRDISFNGQDFLADEEVSGDLDLELLDGTLYWSPLNNVVKLDLGVTVRRMEADFKVSGLGRAASESANKTFPMGYLAARVNLPLTGLYVGGEVNAITYDGSDMRDYTARVGWQSDFLLGVEAGYSRLEVELDDVSGVDTDLEIGGPYLAATLRF